MGEGGTFDIPISQLIREKRYEDIWKLSPYKRLQHMMLNKAPDNRNLRDYVVDKIKTPLMKAICTLARRYPIPTQENTAHPNTRTLLEIMEAFLKYEDNPGRKPMFEALWRMLVCEYEHDSYYRSRIDFVIEKLKRYSWTPRPLEHPYHCWNEPKPFGGGNYCEGKYIGK